MQNGKGHSWISNGLDSKVTLLLIEEDAERVEGEYTDFTELAKFSQEEGIAINTHSIRGGHIAW